MSQLIIPIPEDILLSIKIPKQRMEKELAKELALQLYRENLLSFANAHRLAQLSKVEFHHLLGERQIARQYDEDEYLSDIDTLATWTQENNP